MAYTGASIMEVFFISAATFGTMSLIGDTTQVTCHGLVPSC
jgi:FtsH-binding integral membrane protein